MTATPTYTNPVMTHNAELSPELIVAGFETSCDESSVAVISSHRRLLAHDTFSQIELHQLYGGVVPEISARDHIKRLIPLFKQTLRTANIKLEALSAIAYTGGPGLSGSLLTGAGFGKTISWALDIPSIAIHHMEAHIMASMLNIQKPAFPFLTLLVSGGHTLLVQAESFSCYRVLGTTLDDAVGEAFDKTAKLLGLPYPGGPSISKLARLGNPNRFTFPRPMTNRGGLDMSFSGLKTYTLTTWQKHHANLMGDNLEQLKADIALAFEEAAVDTLLIKCKRALQMTGLNQLVVAGGVSANARLRHVLAEFCQKTNTQLFIPELAYCTDNAAMVAQTGLMRLADKRIDSNLSFGVRPNWSLEAL